MDRVARQSINSECHSIRHSQELTCSYLEEFGEVGHGSDLDIVDVLGAVLLEDGEQVCAGVLRTQYPGQLMEGVG